MIEIGQIARNLDLGPDGLWVSRDRSEVSYPENGNVRCLAVEEDSFWFAHRNRCLVEILGRFPPDGPVFDVGGGNGVVSKAMMDGGFETVLVEPGREGAMNARARGVSPVVCAALEDCGFRESSLPAIGIFDVLEHQKKEGDFLSLLRKLLVPGGRMYVTVPAYYFLWSKDDLRAGHFRRYTTRSLGRALRTAGFEIEFTSYLFWILPAAIFLFRTLPSVLGLHRESGEERIRREHRSPAGPLGWFVRGALDAEWRSWRRGKSSPGGSSCLAVARRDENRR